MRVRDIARIKPHVAKPKTMTLAGFRYGLNTAQPLIEILPYELSELINYKTLPGGRLQVRSGMNYFSHTAVPNEASIIATAGVRIDAENYILIQDEVFNIYYYDSHKDPVLIGTAAGPAEIIGYNGVAIIMDSGYLKYVDKDLTLKIVYDDGSGVAGFMFNNTEQTNDGSHPLGDGTTTRVAWRFITPDFGADYSIPPTGGLVMLSNTLAPSATPITARLRSDIGDHILTEVEIVSDAAADLTDVPEFYGFQFPDDPDEMDANTHYYLSIEHAGGDATNFVNVHYHAVEAGEGHAHTYATNWTQDDTTDPIMALGPGLPPKALFGDIFNFRLFVVDPDERGRAHFCNLTHLDWSTPNFAGWIGAVDDHANSYPIGGIRPLYTDLYLYGTHEYPYIVKLSGLDPTEYSMHVMFQRVSTTQKLFHSVISDLWSTSTPGVDALTGVTQYGDLRSRQVSHPVKDRILEWFDIDTAFAAYYPSDSHYFLVMPRYHRILTSRVIPPERDPYVETQLRHPWQEYEYYRADFSASVFNWEPSQTPGEWYLVEGLSLEEFYVANGGGTQFAVATTTVPEDFNVVSAITSGNPHIVEPDFVTINDLVSNKRPPGDLFGNTWGWGDNDDLGYNTVYVHSGAGHPVEDMDMNIRSVFVPTCVVQAGQNFLMGGSDGMLYQVNPEDWVDMSYIQINPRWRTAYVQFPFAMNNLDGCQLKAGSYYGVDLTMQIFINGMEFEPLYEWQHRLAVSDALTVGEANMILEHADFPVGRENTVPWHWLNINLHSLMLRGYAATVIGWPSYLDGVNLNYRPLQR